MYLVLFLKAILLKFIFIKYVIYHVEFFFQNFDQSLRILDSRLVK